jgi:hypothetical protein
MHETDIRSRRQLDHDDVAALNFVRGACRFVFRRHFRQGLRSHVMEVLARSDLERERRGVVVDGLRRFPDARPLKMLRIFRRRFSGPDEAVEEIRRFQIVEAYLPRDLLALSEEFLVTYRLGDKNHLLLCGLQEYVGGAVLDPWNLPEPGELPNADALVHHARRFAAGAKQMVLEAGYIPDLAGIGNLFVTPEGRIKLVDINNISRLPEGPGICIDDQGYPACDKSIEALYRIERRLCGAAPDVLDGPPYDRHLTAERSREVKALEERFFASLRRGKI